MANLEELAEQQKDVGAQIESIVRNYKKDPVERKQTSAYFKKRLENLLSLWANFESNDTRIRAECPGDRSHDYFTHNYYGGIVKLKEQYEMEFNEKLKKLAEEEAKKTDKGSKPSEPDRVVLMMRRQQEFGKSIRRQLLNSKDTAEISMARKRSIKDTLQRLWNQYEGLHFNIWEIEADPIGLGYNMDEFLSLEEQVNEGILNIEESLEASTTVNPVPALEISKLNLPRISIPKFSGSYLEWKQFYDLFNEMVHRQPIAQCQKMFLLKGNVEGEAAKLISHLTVSEDNYGSAWEILGQRYNNQRLLVNAFIAKLVAQPSISMESANAIRQLHDTTKECLLGLKNLSLDIEQWDPIVMYLLMKKLDPTTHNLYEQTLKNPRTLPPLKEFLEFLEVRFQALEAIGGKGSSKTCLNATNTSIKCLACKDDHRTSTCKKYLKLTPENRKKMLLKAKYCVNCLRPGHYSTKCNSEGCATCKRKHHKTLHDSYIRTTQSTEGGVLKETIVNEKPKVSQSTVSDKPTTTTLTTSVVREPKKGYGLLGTAIISLKNRTGQWLEFRALLDSGSQINIITERAARKLGLTQLSSSLNINGVGLLNKATKRRVYTNISSKVNTFNAGMEAYTMPTIVTNQPSIDFNTREWPIPDNVILADPEFNRPGPVDVLIGVELYFDIVQMKQIPLGEDRPVLQKTVFGWVVAGRIGDPEASSVSTCAVLTNNVELDLRQFWELEEVQSNSKEMSMEEQQCDEHFNRTVKRTPEGRFIVKLPFKEDPGLLGMSKEMAKLRFLSVERRLNLNPALKVDYTKFMHEYIELGHMTEIDDGSITHPAYYLPHHGVIRPESTTTKLRVVFDASATTTKNVSLNELLSTGPTIQDDLFTILLRFRLFKFVFTADIEKMYRQILVNEEDRRFQLIFWRSNDQEHLKTYQLNTVTYGTTSAPYLAIKCLQRLAQIEESNHPTAAAIVQRDFYVDDVMSGFDTITEALHAQRDLTELLRKGGFRLRKWCGNHPKLIDGLHQSDVAVQLDFKSKDNSHIKTLGQTWVPTRDEFQIQIHRCEHGKCTKRTVSSDISRIFDPLGILAPVTVEAKLFLQQLWERKLDWDAKLPEELQAKWNQYMENLNCLNEIKLQRHVFAGEIPTSVQLHAFADASKRAYGGVVYMRSTSPTGRVIVRLLCAKSRLAPIKGLTPPRSELCAALLTVQLTQRIKKCIQHRNVTTYLWSDSEIVLAWINATSSSYSAFVANRIAKIQEISEKSQWHHVRSKENPADMLSRGIAANKLIDNNLWFFGPMFLHGAESNWPPPYTAKSPCNVELKRAVTLTALEAKESHFVRRIDHRNSFSRLERITAYIIRITQRFLKVTSSQTDRQLSSVEISKARTVIFRMVQAEGFPEEIKRLKTGLEVSKSSPVEGLAPFIDAQGLIRVGGRIQASSLSYEAKHPILLPYGIYARMLMEEAHSKNKHIGQTGLIAIINRQCWPLKAGVLARNVVHKCVRCARAKPTLMKQIMGNLPAERVEPARAFLNAGVDFWGPIQTHYRIRGKKPSKSYVAVFCCFATKALHMEVVTDLTTDAFIMALKRFIGRRGVCRKIYCDNATNFVGAKNELGELREAIFHPSNQDKLKKACCFYNIDFMFIPARAPHFGGLWEAAVKSAKNLFKRSVGSASLTYEELETLVIEIEAILNSRPLTQNSSDPNDLAAITAGHFLIGDPITAPVDTEASPLQLSLKKRWERIFKLKEEFWQRWRTEYLSDLQNRVKWRHNETNIQIGQLVLIHEDNTPSMQWPMGRITEVFPGPDGKIRVVNVRTKNGILKRAIHRLAPLPIEQPDPNEENNDNGTEPVTPIPAKGNSNAKPGHIEVGGSTKPKRRRLSLGSVLLTTLLACSVSLSHSSPVVETFNKPGMYFENIGTANILSSEWNIIIYYNLTSFWNAWDSINKATHAMEHICNKSGWHAACSNIVTLYHQWHNDLETEHSLISLSKRQKRGAFDIVGNVANSLFGVLDSSYEQRITKTLNDVNNNEAQLNALLQNHTSVLDATLNIMKRSQEASRQKFTELDDKIIEIMTRDNNISTQLQDNNVFHTFASLALEVLTLTQNFQTQQQAILETVTDGRHGKINPLLISPIQLKVELQSIRNHLNQELKLPIPEDDILQYYQVIKVHSIILPTKIVFSLQLPLTNSETFELFQVTPIPAPLNSTLIIINPISNYIGLNLQKDQLYPFDNNLAGCQEVSNNHYLCHQTHPVYLSSSEVGKCELDLFHNHETKSCKFHKMDQSILWFQLHRSNQWIYASSSPASVNLVCNSTMQHFTLTRSGKLEIKGLCVLKHDQMIIRGHQVYESRIRKAYARFTPTPVLSETVNLPQITYNPSDYVVNPDEIKSLREELKNGRGAILNRHHIHHYVVNYTTLTVLTIVVILMGLWRYTRRRQRDLTKELPASDSPSPAPRSSQNFIVTVEE